MLRVFCCGQLFCLSRNKELEVLLNGRVVSHVKAAAGELELAMRVPACRGIRHIELRWAKSSRLGPSDARVASVLLNALEISEAWASLRQAPPRLELVGSGSQGKLAGAGRLGHVIGNGFSRDGEAVEEAPA